MAPAILSYLGFGSSTPTPAPEPVKDNAVRALPASWYSTQEMYELERRAVFTKKWQLITHKVRLAQPGDWLRFEIVGYSFVLCRNQEGIAGFCDDDGKFVEAPQPAELAELDIKKNSLCPIHTKVDVNGFIWVNLDASENAEPWERDFRHSDVQERFKQFNFDDYFHSHTYSMAGPYNWKILADNFNECYHCPTAHPTIDDLADIESHDVDPVDGYIKHQSIPTEEQIKNGVAIASTYYYPNVSTSVLKNYIMLQRFLPAGPSQSIMEYQIFRHKNSTERDFRFIADLYAQVVSEDKILCELAQKNLNAGVFVNGELHPRLEKGPLYFQKCNRDAIRAHFKLEQAAGREIWPAGKRSN